MICVKRKVAEFFFSLALCIGMLSCASTPKPSAPVEETEPAFEDEEPYVPSAEETVSIPIPKQTSRSYFSTISSSIMTQVETGSPSSLKQAALALRKTGNEGYEENEKVLLVTVSEMLTFAYPSQNVNWELPSVDRSNSYIGALDSARNSIYDSSTGNTDFLTLVLPSFVLLKESVSSNYYDMAESALTQALQKRKDSVIANYLMGLLQEKKGSESLALTYIKTAYNGAKDCVEIARKLADLSYRTGDYAQSYATVQTFLKTYPTDNALLSVGAKAAYALGKLDEAEELALKANQIEGDNLDYVLLRAQILMKKGDYIKASSLLDVYSRTNRTSRDYLLLRSQLQLEWNKSATNAAETISQALALYPSDSDVLLRAAEIASASNSSVGGKTALQLANAVLEKQSENLTALSISITEQVKAGLWSSAYSLSSRLIAKSDAPVSAFHTHVEICISLGRTEEAWNLASRLYEQNKSDETCQQTYIKALIATGRNEQTSRLIDSLLNGASARMKSFLYYQRSRLDATEEAVLADLRSSLTANPRNEDALYRLYELYYQKSDWRRAQYYLKQVVALNPNDARLLRLNAELDTLLGR